MKRAGGCVSSLMPSDAKGMRNVRIGGGTTSRVQLNRIGSVGGRGLVVSGCMTVFEIRRERSWSMGGLAGSSGPILLVMVRRTSGYAARACIWAMIIAKPAIIVGVAPFCSVSWTKASWSTQPSFSPTVGVALVGAASGVRCREFWEV